MAVTATTSTLSTNAKYINYSASTASADAKTLLLAITDALVAMPAPNQWSRFDSPGGTSVLGTDDDCTTVLRRQTKDFATTSDYQYLGLNMSHTGSNAFYTLYLTQTTDWTSATSATAYGNVCAGPDATFLNTKGLRIPDSLINYSASGTIWLFNENFGTYFVFTGTGITQGYENSYYVGEYAKDFGENAPTGTTIHPAVAVNLRYFFKGSGTAMNSVRWTADNNYRYNQGGGTDFAGHLNSQYQSGHYHAGSTYNASHYNSFGNEWRAQFALAEYPTVASASNQGKGFTRTSSEIGTPAQWNLSYPIGLTTRLHMGWLGWMGHTTSLNAWSLVSHWHHNGGTGTNHNGSQNPNTFRNSLNGYGGSLRGYGLNQYTPDLANGNSIAVYEPTLSTGTINSNYNYYGTYSPYNQSTSTTVDSTTGIAYRNWNFQYYAGTATKFSLLGRLKNFRFSIGHGDMEYEFLDTGTLTLNSEGEFDAAGTSTECWAIPFGNHSLQAGATCWVKK